MDVICITLKVESVMANDLAKGEHVDREKKGSKDRALRHSLIDWGRGGTGTINGDKL